MESLPSPEKRRLVLAQYCAKDRLRTPALLRGARKTVTVDMRLKSSRVSHHSQSSVPGKLLSAEALPGPADHCEQCRPPLPIQTDQLSGLCKPQIHPADPPPKTVSHKISFRIKLSLDIIFKRFNITEFATGSCFFRQKVLLTQRNQQPMSVQGGIVTHVLFKPTDIEITPNFRDLQPSTQE